VDRILVILTRVATAHVLIIGLDPQAVPGVDARAVERGLAYGLERIRAAGYRAEQVLVPLDESALEQIAAAIAAQAWDAVVIGAVSASPSPSWTSSRPS
jgi:N-methylhydantoinase A/oxoprolinase/acetone carboxylase beta subunit